jgi:hypothetical protein
MNAVLSKIFLLIYKSLEFKININIFLKLKTQPPIPLLLPREGGIKGG